MHGLILADDPHGGGFTLLEHGGERNHQRVGGLLRRGKLHAGSHAQAYFVRAVQQGDARRVSARGGVGGGGQLTQPPAQMLLTLGGKQGDVGQRADLELAQAHFRHGNRHFAFAILRQLQHRLPGRHDLPDLGQDGRHHPGALGTQFGVGRLVARQPSLGNRRLQGGFLGVQRRLADEFFGEQFAVAVRFVLRQFQLRLGGIALQRRIRDIQPRQHLPGGNLLPDFHQSRRHLATQPETEWQLMPGAHVAVVLPDAGHGMLGNLQSEGGTRGWHRRRGRFVTRCQQKQHNQRGDFHECLARSSQREAQCNGKTCGCQMILKRLFKLSDKRLFQPDTPGFPRDSVHVIWLDTGPDRPC